MRDTNGARDEAIDYGSERREQRLHRERCSKRVMRESIEVVDEREPKRVFIDINGWAEPRMTAHLTEVGCARTVVSGLGGFATSTSSCWQ